MVAEINDIVAMERMQSWEKSDQPATIFELLSRTQAQHGNSNAFSFQLLSDSNSPSETLTWNDAYKRVCQTANFFHSLGLKRNDVVAFLLPNCNETIYTLWGGMIVSKINPINPLLGASQIAGILRTSKAKVLVTLASFPRSNVAQLAAAALAEAPDVEHVVQVGLARYLKPPKSWLIPLVRPKSPDFQGVTVHDFYEAIDLHNAESLNFADDDPDRIVALFHTGGTTGLPKLAQHKQVGMIYNGWCGKLLGITAEDNVICPLPLFHVFAAYPIMATAMYTGAHVIFPTPSGYRGEGVFDQFWNLVERWKVTFMITVPTAMSVLMQKPVDADVATLKAALCGSAPLPVELYNKFEKATGVTIMEGYGLTEVTCIVSVNPRDGVKKVGSVGLRFPYTNVRILECDENGEVKRECDVDEVGEICISSPGVLTGNTYSESEKNIALIADGKWLRTGDLGKLDDDGYLWITGRAKDLIIRGGQNVDPAIIEEAFAGHPEVALAGAIGQPDIKMGELPCAYVELVEGSGCTAEELMQFSQDNIKDKLALPTYVEVLSSLPKTAVGKIFKPDLRKLAINRVLRSRFRDANLDLSVNTIEKPKVGLVALIGKTDEESGETARKILGEYSIAWEFEE